MLYLFLLLAAKIGETITPNHYYLSLTLNTTWSDLCPQIDLFRNHLSYQIKMDLKRIFFANENDHCPGERTDVILYMFITKENSKDHVVDLQATLNAEHLLSNRMVIGQLKIISMDSKNTKQVKRRIYSPQTIAIVIGVVLGIYLIGHFLILSMKSYTSRDSKERPISWIVSAQNLNFSQEDGKPMKESRKFKMKKVLSKSKQILPKNTGKHRVSLTPTLSTYESYSKLPE